MTVVANFDGNMYNVKKEGGKNAISTRVATGDGTSKNTRYDTFNGELANDENTSRVVWGNVSEINKGETTNRKRLSGNVVSKTQTTEGLEESSSFIEGGFYNEIEETIEQNDSGRKKTIFEKSRWKNNDGRN